jgi:hypothetical protein
MLLSCLLPFRVWLWPLHVVLDLFLQRMIERGACKHNQRTRYALHQPLIAAVCKLPSVPVTFEIAIVQKNWDFFRKKQTGARL